VEHSFAGIIDITWAPSGIRDSFYRHRVFSLRLSAFISELAGE